MASVAPTKERDVRLQDVRALTYNVIPLSMLMLLVAFITCTLIYTINLQQPVPSSAAIAITVLFGALLLLFAAGTLIIRFVSSSPSNNPNPADPEAGTSTEPLPAPAPAPAPASPPPPPQPFIPQSPLEMHADAPVPAPAPAPAMQTRDPQAGQAAAHHHAAPQRYRGRDYGHGSDSGPGGNGPSSHPHFHHHPRTAPSPSPWTTAANNPPGPRDSSSAALELHLDLPPPPPSNGPGIRRPRRTAAAARPRRPEPPIPEEPEPHAEHDWDAAGYRPYRQGVRVFLARTEGVGGREVGVEVWRPRGGEGWGKVLLAVEGGCVGDGEEGVDAVLWGKGAGGGELGAEVREEMVMGSEEEDVDAIAGGEEDPVLVDDLEARCESESSVDAPADKARCESESSVDDRCGDGSRVVERRGMRKAKRPSSRRGMERPLGRRVDEAWVPWSENGRARVEFELSDESDYDSAAGKKK